VKNSKKFPNVFGGYLMPLNILPKKEETYYYTYSLRMGCILCLEVVVKSVPHLRSRCKNSPSDLFMFRFMMTFTLCYCNILDPLFWECPPPMVFYLTQEPMGPSPVVGFSLTYLWPPPPSLMLNVFVSILLVGRCSDS